jgi:hypothetical protein
MAKKMIIKGVGQFMAKRYAADGKGVEVITLGSLQNIKIDLNVEIDDIFGGDGFFPIDTLVKNKSIEITATDAKFDLAAVQLMMGSTVQEGITTSLWVLGEQDTATAGVLNQVAVVPVVVAVAPVNYGDSLFGGGNFAVKMKDSNKLLTEVPYSATVAPLVGEFMIDTAYYNVIQPISVAGVIGDDFITVPDASGFKAGDDIKVGSEAPTTVVSVAGNVITIADDLVANQATTGKVINYTSLTARVILNTASANFDIVFNYQRSATGVDVVDLLVNEVPFAVHVIHHGSYLQKDGKFAGVETELYSCRAKGQFAMDSQRASASASQVMLQVLDPERTDGKLGSIKRYASDIQV